MKVRTIIETGCAVIVAACTFVTMRHVRRIDRVLHEEGMKLGRQAVDDAEGNNGRRKGHLSIV